VKRETTNKLRRTLALGPTLLVAITISMLLRTAAYCQQEVDPTWYNPWPVSNESAVKASQPRAARQKPKQKSSSVSQHTPDKKARVRRYANPATQAHAEVAKKGEIA
jgi:hypothetical protein